MRHEVYHEYEKCKREIFSEKKTLADYEPALGETQKKAPFHPIFMSALMNQQVFLREALMYEFEKGKSVVDSTKSVQLERTLKEDCSKITEYVKNWISTIEVNNYLDDLLWPEKELAYNLLELLEKCQTQWDDANL